MPEEKKPEKRKDVPKEKKPQKKKEMPEEKKPEERKDVPKEKKPQKKKEMPEEKKPEERKDVPKEKKPQKKEVPAETTKKSLAAKPNKSGKKPKKVSAAEPKKPLELEPDNGGKPADQDGKVMEKSGPKMALHPADKCETDKIPAANASKSGSKAVSKPETVDSKEIKEPKCSEIKNSEDARKIFAWRSVHRAQAKGKDRSKVEVKEHSKTECVQAQFFHSQSFEKDYKDFKERNHGEGFHWEEAPLCFQATIRFLWQSFFCK